MTYLLTQNNKIINLDNLDSILIESETLNVVPILDFIKIVATFRTSKEPTMTILYNSKAFNLKTKKELFEEEKIFAQKIVKAIFEGLKADKKGIDLSEIIHFLSAESDCKNIPSWSKNCHEFRVNTKND